MLDYIKKRLLLQQPLPHYKKTAFYIPKIKTPSRDTNKMDTAHRAVSNKTAIRAQEVATAE